MTIRRYPRAFRANTILVCFATAVVCLFLHVFNQSQLDRRLVFAIEQGRFDQARMLLQSGADANASVPWVSPNSPWCRFLSLLPARFQPVGSESALLALLEFHDVTTTYPFRLVYWPEDAELTRMLLERGANVNLRDSMGESPLTLAVGSNKRDTALLLIQHGANVNGTGRDNKTALIYAIDNADYVVARALIAAGANPNARDNSGDTALIIASNSTTPRDLVQLLKAAGGRR